ncbi:2,3-bisphosphoglycerate-independent phosphoglycerate mutase [uncultured Ellagibacter sp.]|uniref:2,3-bisphosphoglycerate-independent phosphoglycerate mutase n=1 Tax=uncultured Ellagibacter sp. TaxID=2137580 RepID=UPI0025D34093|nr:2,3-bisphosphoglycerate-independent phosphoglycerate mutase [uncultured Ellagibacter sp.]
MSVLDSSAREGLALPVCLVIMDGLGLAPAGPGNAISLAHTPFLDKLFAGECTRLQASGEAVGLPEGQMGNSEVGHLNIGAGRVVHQELTRINRACRTGSIDENEVINACLDVSRASGCALHVMGLLSDGGVHSSNEHLFAILEHAVSRGLEDIRVHCFLDGRDVPPSSGEGYVAELEQLIVSKGWESKVRIASVSGRYYAMDRDKRWDRVQKAWEAIVRATPSVDCGACDVVADSYAEGVTDEFVVPRALDSRGVRDGDGVIFFNFRPDRARELTRAFVDPAFDGFERPVFPQVNFVCLTEYDPDIPAPVAFPKEFPDNVLADVLATRGLRQYHIAETEKYAHVTFFLNGGREEPKSGEERQLVASPKVATYDLQPEMSEPEVARDLAQAIAAAAADVYIVNFANCDMVGHTGVIPAAVAAVEAVDAGVEQVLSAVKRAGGVAFVTADHGNADKMLAEDGSPHTAHTTAPVPFALADFSGRGLRLSGEEGALCDIAPTMLAAMGVDIPPEMTGKSLLA